MRFPFSLSIAAGAHIARNILAGRRRFSMVLMLEPLHACNLRCSGCGRIREYPQTIGQTMSVEECLAAVSECGAPIVSVCGGEPLLYRKLPKLLDRLLDAGKHIYLCTNGQILEESIPTLLSIKNPRLTKRCYLNVHLDGPAQVHDAAVEKAGAFDRALAGIDAAKKARFRVYTNTTVYARTTVDDLIDMAKTLSAKNIDGLMISPAYGYEAVKEGAADADALFMDRPRIEAFFRQVRRRMSGYRLTATPVYFDFLTGQKELTCAAWANPTRNVAGWRSPCYLIGDAHFSTYHEFLEKTDWEKIGPGRDERCRDCMTHCGFEPASVLAVISIPLEFFRREGRKPPVSR